jgi:uncharacterized protein YheU (UPF0270 family)
MYKATVKLQFDSKWESNHYSSGYEDGLLPEEHIVMEVPAHDLNTKQLFNLFEKFLLSMGHTEKGICEGALYLSVNEVRSNELVRELCREFDLTMNEDMGDLDEWKNRAKKYEDLYWNLHKKVKEQEAIISRLQNPDNPQYTEEEMDVMLTPWGHSDMEALRYSQEELNEICMKQEPEKTGPKWWEKQISQK